MVEKWYKGYKSKDKPSELAKQISKKVQEHSLSNYIPLLRIEKGAKANKWYYFFLAIVSEKKGEIPEAIIKSKLLELPSFKIKADRSDPPFTTEQIKDMSNKGYDIEDFIELIPYETTNSKKFDDPFNLLSSNGNTGVEEDPQKYQYLLYWLSNVGKGTWESFKKTCQVLELYEPKRVLRRLKILGHLEIYGGGQKWAIIPTTLVEIAHNKYILCGQRNEKLVNILQKLVNVQSIEQTLNSAAACIAIEIADLMVIKSIQDDLDIKINFGQNLSQRLAETLPNIDEFNLSLGHLQGIVPSIYQWQKFNNNYVVDCPIPQETGLYQMSNTIGFIRTVFYDSITNTYYQGDWYGLRFLDLFYRHDKLIASYDNDKLRLAIPAQQRWPEIYEKSLVLASGLLPIYTNSWLIYENISYHLAQQMTTKLQIDMQEIKTNV